MPDNYLNAYAALAKKKQDEDAAATAIAPTEGERETVKDQSSLAALVGSLMKAQAGMGSIGGKATANPDINYGQYADINSKDLLARRAKSDDMLRIADKNYQGGRQSISDTMGAQQFNNQQSQAPVDLQQRKANLELTKQQILMGGRNPTDVDKDLANLQRIQKIRDTVKLIAPSDPEKASQLSQQADFIERKYTGKSESPGQQATDKTFGKDYADYIKAGGSADVDKSLKSLQEVSDALGSGKASTGPMQGFLAQYLPGVRNTVSPDSVTAQQKVEQAASGSVKSLVGARVTQMEFMKLLQQAYNPSLPPDENKRRVDAMIQNITSKRDSMEAAGKYFESNNGSLRNYKATEVNSSKGSKPKRVMQNGHEYLLNETTGQYE